MDLDGNIFWSGNIPGRLVGGTMNEAQFIDDDVLSSYTFIDEGKVLVHEVLCRNTEHCGSFVSRRYIDRCPSCNGEDILIRHQFVDGPVISV